MRYGAMPSVRYTVPLRTNSTLLTASDNGSARTLKRGKVSHSIVYEPPSFMSKTRTFLSASTSTKFTLGMKESGTCVGVFVGAAEGNFVGELEGREEGDAVGDAEGLLDGKGVGPLVGPSVGPFVGEDVGFADGEGEGCAEGEEVG